MSYSTTFSPRLTQSGLPVSPSPHIRAATASSPSSPAFTSSTTRSRPRSDDADKCSSCGSPLPTPKSGSDSARAQRSTQPGAATQNTPASRSSSILRLGQKLKDQLRGRLKGTSDPDVRKNPGLGVSVPRRTPVPKQTTKKKRQKAADSPKSPQSPDSRLVVDHWAEY